MPSASTLSAYLAKNYLTADTPSISDKKSKKRKRQSGPSHATSPLTIADDSNDTWGISSSKPTQNEDDTPAPIFNSHSAEFRRKKDSQWQTLSGAPATLSSANEASADAAAAAEAEAIIRSAADERSARAAAEQDDPDEAPAVLDTLRMSNGAHAGLQSASSMAAQIASHRAQEHAAEGDRHGSGKGETIYRDASGRIVNIAMKRAEARAAADAAEEKKRKEIEAARGDVQRVQREERRQELEDAKLMPFARGVDDEDMNAELRARDVWGDPMAGQLSTSVSKGKSEKKSAPVVKTSITGRPLYPGSAPPNRYGIRPGHKWDGVDRGTGFESEWFKARNAKKDRQALEWNWQMDE